MLRAALLTCSMLLSAASGQTASPPPGNAAPPDSTAPHKVGGDVLPPKLIHQVDPNYPRNFFGRARSSRVLIGLVVNADGLPERPHIIRSGGSAFDKSALECVAQYRFSPAMQHGMPVPVEVNIDVNFQVYKGSVPPSGPPAP